MNNQLKIEYTEIKTVKISKNVYQASCIITKPIKSEVNMKGSTEENAKRKLELFLNYEPYAHLS